jgi:hypothetical protein
MLAKNPKDRPDFTELLSHNFFSDEGAVERHRLLVHTRFVIENCCDY